MGSKIEVNNDLKIRSVKIEKFDSRLDGSSIFEISRETKIDEQSMPKDFKIGPHLKSGKNSKKLPT